MSTPSSTTPSENSPLSGTEVEIAREIIGGTEWVVVESDAASEPELEGNQGICHKPTQRLLINRAEVPPAGYDFVRFHEEFHASVWMNGGLYGLQRIIGCDDEKMEEIEEYIITSWGQAMFDTLTRNGHLTYK